MGASSDRETIQARKEAFAVRIAGRGRQNRGPGQSPSSTHQRSVVPPAPSAVQAGEALRRHVAERREAARKAQIKTFVEAAEQAQQHGDPAAAGTSYQLAIQLAPDDLDLIQARDRAQASATTILAGSYLQQARYEEGAERWRDAARSYAKAADGMPSNEEAQAKAAAMMLKANIDVRKAADYAKCAIELNPKNAHHHVTLGQIYLAAGMVHNGRRELEQAAQLAPNDTTIAILLESVRKGAKT